jgi:hypothetical protein
MNEARVDRASAGRKIGSFDELEDAGSLDAVKLLLDGGAPAVSIIALEKKTRRTGFLSDKGALRLLDHQGLLDTGVLFGDEVRIRLFVGAVAAVVAVDDGYGNTLGGGDVIAALSALAHRLDLLAQSSRAIVKVCAGAAALAGRRGCWRCRRGALRESVDAVEDERSTRRLGRR